ncbi:MAG: hypothetical protein ABIQ98_07325 [Sphingomicrobium sp.]
MGEPRTFASLSSGLLARKGAARPAMRPQGFAQIGATLEDLGWNDMGFEPPKPAISVVRDAEHDAFGEELPEPAIRHPLAGLTPSGPSASPVHDQHAELADRFAGYDLEPGEEIEEDETAEPLHFAPAVKSVETPAKVVSAPKLQAVVHRVVATPTPVPAPTLKSTPRAAPGTKAKAAFTLRLDPARHLKLRLACAVSGRSAQVLVTEALDELLAGMPELDGMAERAPVRKAN